MKRSRVFACLLALMLARLALQAGETPQITPDIVYGHKDGMALTFDLVKPEQPNGAAVLWIQSGGWYSTWQEPKNLLPGCAPLLAEHMTVFIVRHGSAPKYTVPEAIADLRRAVRFIHLRAAELGVDANRLGVTGASAGGHLSLLLATTGDDGNPKAKDEVLRASSRIAAAVALCPPTDIRGWMTDPPQPIKDIPMLKPPLTFAEEKGPELSPILHVSAATAPVLLVHGDKDGLVFPEHSEKMYAELQRQGVKSRLLMLPGAGHSFGEQEYKVLGPAMLAWFKEFLAPANAKAGE